MRGFPLELSTIMVSLKVTVTVMLSFNLYEPSAVEDETLSTVGAVVSTTNVLTLNALLAFPAESVTVMVQSAYCASLNAVELSGCVRVTVLLSEAEVADVVELPQLPP